MPDGYARIIQLLFEAAIAGVIGGAMRALYEKGQIRSYINRCFIGVLFSTFLGYGLRLVDILLNEKDTGWNFPGLALLFTAGYFTKEVARLIARKGMGLFPSLFPKSQDNGTDTDENP